MIDARVQDAGPRLVQDIRDWARELGFSQIGIAGIDLSDAEPGLLAWLEAGFHGGMDYMPRHGLRRARPAELVPGTVSVIVARMDYLPRHAPPDWARRELGRLTQSDEAVVSVYARGRDYHKVLRSRLQQLAHRIAEAVGPHGHRVFCDSAPVLEVELASRAGLGWRGKHTLLLARESGSMFFLGEICTTLDLPRTAPETAHCGHCTACVDVCPTQAIVAPYRLDARRCISYLTIEHDGSIPEPLRAAFGARLHGCDDCQLVCPWNKFARPAVLADFDPRPDGPDGQPLPRLWAWDEAEFLRRTEGSAIRRIGWRRWRRNLAVVSGNALRRRDDAALRQALAAALAAHAGDALLTEHIGWALAQAAPAGGR